MAPAVHTQDTFKFPLDFQTHACTYTHARTALASCSKRQASRPPLPPTSIPPVQQTPLLASCTPAEVGVRPGKVRVPQHCSTTSATVTVVMGMMEAARVQVQQQQEKRHPTALMGGQLPANKATQLPPSSSTAGYVSTHAQCCPCLYTDGSRAVCTCMGLLFRLRLCGLITCKGHVSRHTCWICVLCCVKGVWGLQHSAGCSQLRARCTSRVFAV